MRILAHRGLWNADQAGNSKEALRGALTHGFGFESDVRDSGGELVISHNIPSYDAWPFEQALDLLEKQGDQFAFAINIKADGLKNLLGDALRRHGIQNYFLVDMSVPQMVEFAEVGLRFVTRQSEFEQEPVLYEKAAGVWIDGFRTIDWINEELLTKHLSAGKDVCLVSPELHGREHLPFWEMLKAYDGDHSKLYLCTDHPLEARTFFGDLMGA